MKIKSNNLINSIIDSEELNEEYKNILTYIAFNREQPSQNWLKYMDSPPEIDVDKTLKYLVLKMRLHKIVSDRLIMKNNLRQVNNEEGLELLSTIKEFDRQISLIKKKLEEL